MHCQLSQFLNIEAQVTALHLFLSATFLYTLLRHVSMDMVYITKKCNPFLTTCILQIIEFISNFTVSSSYSFCTFS